MTDYERFKDGMSGTPFDHCRYNMQKGLWETHPAHWTTLPDDRGSVWVGIGFPSATVLERGLSEDGGRDAE